MTTNFIQHCPLCGRPHESKDHDVGWYFVCCGHARLVWVELPGGALELQLVPEDSDDYPER